MADDSTRSHPAAYPAEKFLKFDYPETRDLCTQFLTLIAGILAVSVTFSEKIVAPDARFARILLGTSWLLFLLALIGTGGGLYQIFVAGQKATRVPDNTAARDFNWALSFRSLNLAGVAFVIGLLLLILSGLFSIWSRSGR